MTELYDAGKEIDFQKARARLEELTKPQDARRLAETSVSKDGTRGVPSG